MIAARLFAQGESFTLRIDSPAPYTPTYLGNGYIGVSTSQLGTTPAESLMAGLYDRTPNDVPRIAGLPAWNEVNVFNGQSWLNDTPPEAMFLHSYQQTVNMYDGTVRTEYQWEDHGRAVSVGVDMFVSRLDQNLAVVRLEVTPHYSGPMKVALSLQGWDPPKRFALARLDKLDPKVTQQELWYPGYMMVENRSVETKQHGAMLRMSSHPEGATDVVAETAALSWPEDLRSLAVSKTSRTGVAAVELSFDGVAGEHYVFTKYVAAVRSQEAEDAVKRATQLAQSANSRGYDAVFQRSSREWNRLWETDIIVDGAPELQRVIHSMLFYLLSSVRAGSDWSIPPMGLSTAGYYGHVFWDADTFMFPALMILHPDLAKPIVMFRANTLRAAMANAYSNGWKGAMYPWEAGPDGAETTPRFAFQNATSEIHVNGDVALAQWQYYLASGDKEYLEKYGYPVLRETANFWASHVIYDRDRDRYEIPKVTSWIESEIGVNNDAYTNAVAAKNLELAIAAAKVVGEKPNAAWEKVRQKLYLPAGATLLVSYPLGEPVSVEAKQKEVEDAIHRFQARQFGVMMGDAFYPILAVEAADRKLLDEVFPYTYKPYFMPVFNVLRETPNNTNINFLTGAGGFLQQFVFGYTGLRFSDEGLSQKYRPLLPDGVTKLTLKNVTVRGQVRNIVIASHGG